MRVHCTVCDRERYNGFVLNTNDSGSYKTRKRKTPEIYRIPMKRKDKRQRKHACVVLASCVRRVRRVVVAGAKSAQKVGGGPRATTGTRRRGLGRACPRRRLRVRRVRHAPEDARRVFGDWRLWWRRWLWQTRGRADVPRRIHRPPDGVVTTRPFPAAFLVRPEPCELEKKRSSSLTVFPCTHDSYAWPSRQAFLARGIRVLRMGWGDVRRYERLREKKSVAAERMKFRVIETFVVCETFNSFRRKNRFIVVLICVQHYNQ